MRNVTEKAGGPSLDGPKPFSVTFLHCDVNMIMRNVTEKAGNPSLEGPQPKGQNVFCDVALYCKTLPSSNDVSHDYIFTK